MNRPYALLFFAAAFALTANGSPHLRRETLRESEPQRLLGENRRQAPPFDTKLDETSHESLTDIENFRRKLEIQPKIRKWLSEVTDSVWRDELMIAAATSKGRAACHDPGQEWLVSQVNAMGPDTFEILLDLGILEMTFVYKYLVDKNEAGEYIGVSNHFTDEIKERHDMAEEFWESTDHADNFDTDDILLLGMHGADLQSSENVAAVMTFMYDLSQLTSYEISQFNQFIRDTISGLPHGFDNPLLSFDAVAMDGPAFTNYVNDGTTYPDAVLIGDGIIEYLEQKNLHNDGPDFVHAHEFGHHVIFETGMDEVNVLANPNEETRRIELLTDTLAGYFLVHPQGGQVCFERMEEVHQAAFHAGDCDVEHEFHHGTPKQRECAVKFGATLSLQNANMNFTLPPKVIGMEFQEVLPKILALDSEVCTFQVPDGMVLADCEPGNESSAPSRKTLLHVGLTAASLFALYSFW